MTVLRHADQADICLVLEGTFPYVRGGVSAWVNTMLHELTEYRFAIVYIGSTKADCAVQQYDIPANVVYFEQIFLHEGLGLSEPEAMPGSDQLFDTVSRIHGQERDRGRGLLPESLPTRGSTELFASINDFHGDQRSDGTSLHAQQMLEGVVQLYRRWGDVIETEFHRSELAWRYICTQYSRFCTDPSFINYFWTVKNMHAPLWQVMRAAVSPLKVRLYHAISTGYAGFFGAFASVFHETPFVVTEHGIYSKERKIDLAKTDWIADSRNVFQRDSLELAYFRSLWIRFFYRLGSMAYSQASAVSSLYGASRQQQIEDGALPEKTLVIPNGVDVKMLSALREQRREDNPPVAVLIGRVVPIKDIKTFIRSMRIVRDRIPAAEAWIVGPEEESPEYAAECRNLVASYGLQECVRFLGFQNVHDIFPKARINVLSSISEALPLVVLEGYAAGVPAVCTDVGSCRELIQGRTDDDRALGESGALVPISSPQALADAMTRLLADDAAWLDAQRAAIARVERYYTQEQMFSAYRGLYERVLA
ncbi:MAG: GT4 family glycosyltransferase PelF [Nitrospiraceae bacterium]|nr:GT4 family glycosyltransferase PelF [Nitrospiraceae bacterium]